MDEGDVIFPVNMWNVSREDRQKICGLSINNLQVRKWYHNRARRIVKDVTISYRDRRYDGGDTPRKYNFLHYIVRGEDPFKICAETNNIYVNTVVSRFGPYEKSTVIAKMREYSDGMGTLKITVTKLPLWEDIKMAFNCWVRGICK